MSHTNQNILAQYFTSTDHMSYEVIDAKPIDYDFSQAYDYDQDDTSWYIVHHPSIESQVEDLSVVDLPSAREGADPLVSAGAPDTARLSCTSATGMAT